MHMIVVGLAMLAVALAALIAAYVRRGQDGAPRRDLQVISVWMLVSGIGVLGLWVTS